MFDPFHFIQPLWLLALLPLAGLLWLLSQQVLSNNPWQKIVDPRLLPLLMGKKITAAASPAPLWLLAAGWLITVLALANPTWEQVPQPVMQTSTSRVIVLDLSRSMLAADLKPSRLVRARFKVEDILAYDDEGQTGLIVFAGDAFSVTPLTRDTGTIRAQLKALEPAIMPSQGSRADLGLLKALELMQQAGVQTGQVILIADGVEDDRAIQAATRLRKSGYPVSILGVGTAAGAPLPDGRGGVTKSAPGKPQLVKLDSKKLQAVAQAGGGRYTQLSGNRTDISYLLDVPKSHSQKHQSHDVKTQKWQQQGPLLAVLLLPLAALAFRRGWLLSVALCISLVAQPGPAMAFSWDDLWLRKDQQAAQALQQEQYEQAAQLAATASQRGSAEYKKGNYQKALEAFNTADGTDATYNRGNALAKLGQYQDAIDAYDEALEATPGMEDAIVNKAAIEALLKKQKQQQQDSSNQEDKQGKQSDGGDSPPDNENESKQSQNSETGSNESSDSKNSQSSEDQAGKKGNQQQDSSDNQFADANQQLDNDQSDQQDEKESGRAPAGNKDEAKPAQSDEENKLASTGQPTEAEPLTSEEQLAAQQWLRRIPDDPGGLLRRKFLYQYRQRNIEQSGTQDW